MKPKIILFGIIATVALWSFACSSESLPSRHNTECSFAWNQKTEVAVGDTLTVNLEANPTTGFEWELREMTDETVLEEEGHAYVAPESEATVGAGGKEVWTFKALKEGESTIIMEYRRPWEQEVEPDKVFILTVAVK